MRGHGRDNTKTHRRVSLSPNTSQRVQVDQNLGWQALDEIKLHSRSSLSCDKIRWNSAILFFRLLDPIFSKSFADWRPAGGRTGDERSIRSSVI
jgi:hypothetical protein